MTLPPKTQTELSNAVQSMRQSRKKQDYARALAICQHLIINESTRAVGYRERAEVWQDISEIDLALYDMRQLLAFGSEEPADYYSLGIILLKKTEAREASDILQQGIELCKKHRATYYLQSCRFHRAAALLKLGSPKEALEECSKIEDGYECFLPNEGIKTKEDLITEAQRASKSR